MFTTFAQRQQANQNEQRAAKPAATTNNLSDISVENQNRHEQLRRDRNDAASEYTKLVNEENALVSRCNSHLTVIAECAVKIATFEALDALNMVSFSDITKEVADAAKQRREAYQNYLANDSAKLTAIQPLVAPAFGRFEKLRCQFGE